MIAKLPVLEGECDTVTMMSYGLDPYLSEWSPYHGSVYAVVSSVAKIVASGGDFHKIRFTFQEYFRRLGQDAKRWGEPMAALLGAYDVQMKLGLASIGGKDSMSGSFNDIDVPPTLCSFAVDVAKQGDVITPELKTPGNILVKFDIAKDEYDLPDYDQLMKLYSSITELIHNKTIVSAYAVGFGGICEAVSKMAFGNEFGVALQDTLSLEELFVKDYGSVIAEIAPEDYDSLGVPCKKIGMVTEQPAFVIGSVAVSMKEALEAWTGRLETVFPTRSGVEPKALEDTLYDAKQVYTAKSKMASPKVFIPVFPGTNCEYDTAKAFREAGAQVETLVFCNMTESQIVESVAAFEKAIRDSQILMFSGGFSAGDEPDGSAKFIASVFRNPKIMDAVHDLLQKRDGLALGICNGFQALIKLGLVPYGEIKPQKADAPTLTTNSIGRHISKSVYTKVVTNKSPWLMRTELGGVYAIPASHGEGRFVASEETIKQLFANGQVATRYVDLAGVPTMDEEFNPNGSYAAIEGITSPDGRVLGKMAHSERIGDGVAVNIYGNQNQHIFESGVAYFK
jgi:phosphoribosylformylglycinamidine synthase